MSGLVSLIYLHVCILTLYSRAFLHGIHPKPPQEKTYHDKKKQTTTNYRKPRLVIYITTFIYLYIEWSCGKILKTLGILYHVVLVFNISSELWSTKGIRLLMLIRSSPISLDEL